MTKRRRDAFGYLRVSGKGQENGNGFERQRETIENFAKGAGYNLLRCFEDIHTGTVDAVLRPGFAEMVGKTNGAQTIIVERLDRLARSVTAQENTVVWLTAHGIELVVADTGENVSEAYHADPMKKALIQMQGVFSELEKSMLVRKLRAAREKIRKEKGKCEGMPYFGEINPVERETVDRIRELKRKRGKNKLSLRKIAEILDAEGRKTRYGGKWSGQVVKNILDRKRKG